MKKLAASFSALICLSIFLPLTTFAQGTQYDTFNTPNISSDGVIEGKGFIPCSGTNCSPCDLIVLFNTVLKWFLTISFLIFAIVALVAGIKLVTQGNPGALADAKKSFTNAFIGLIIILSAFLIVDTLMRYLVRDGGNIDGYGPWQKVACASQSEATTKQFFEGDEVYEPAVINGQPTPSGNPALAGAGLTDSVARERLLAAGIQLKPGISLAGVRPHVIDELIKLRNGCRCTFMITSGTDGTHSTTGDFSHANGFKIDIRTDIVLYNYVKTFQRAAPWKDGTVVFYDQSACATYAFEKDHLDVAFRTGC